MLRVGVLASGSGTNFCALRDACTTGYADATIACVLTNRADAGVLHRAGDTPAVFVDPSAACSREEYDRMLVHHLEEHGVELVCGAGYMRLLSSGFVRHFENRILNVHPSLLPAFPGLDAIGQAWKHGVKVTGVTVHVIDDKLDNGPILFQRAVEVPGSLADLEQSIHKVEYTLYPMAVKAWAAGAVSIEGRRVEFSEDTPEPPWAGGLPPSLE